MMRLIKALLSFFILCNIFFRSFSAFQSMLFMIQHIPGGQTLSRMLGSFFAAAAAKSLQSFPTLCDPIDSSPPGSPVPGILKARTLEWVAISFAVPFYLGSSILAPLV